MKKTLIIFLIISGFFTFTATAKDVSDEDSTSEKPEITIATFTGEGFRSSLDDTKKMKVTLDKGFMQFIMLDESMQKETILAEGKLSDVKEDIFTLEITAIYLEPLEYDKPEDHIMRFTRAEFYNWEVKEWGQTHEEATAYVDIYFQPEHFDYSLSKDGYSLIIDPGEDIEFVMVYKENME